jgi:hypothetical protein
MGTGPLTIRDPGAFGAGDTLVPIPNTKVKTRCGDDTRKGKVARCRIIQKPAERQVFGVNSLMFQPWIKKKAFKKAPQGNQLVITGGRPSVISLLSLSAILVGAGVFVIQHSLADSSAPDASPSPLVSVAATTTPTTTPTMTPTPTHYPAGQR